MDAAPIIAIKTSEAAVQEPIKYEAPREMNATKKGHFDLEKYIGENLISKIGIAILIIGVAIGAKYSIILISLAIPVGYLLLSISGLYIGLFILFLFYLVRGFATPVLKDYINRKQGHFAI